MQKIRIAIAIILLSALTIFLSVEPAVNTALAVNQANDTVSSTYAFTSYQGIRGYAWLGYIIIPIVCFWKEIKKSFKQ